MFSASANGVLAYRMAAETQLTWFDRTGRPLGPIGPVGNYLQFALSPADTLVAAARLDPNTGTSDIWILDGAGAGVRRITFEKARAAHPLWSRDSSSVVFASDRRGRWEIRRKPLNEDRGDEELLASDGSVVPTDWSPDGRLLFFQWGHGSKGFSLLGLNDLNRSESSHPIQLPYLGLDENAGRISPDGRWLAYSVWDSGWSVYVQPLHSAEGRWQLSPPGSVEPQPKWRTDGKELFFISDDMSLMAVDLEPGETFRASAPHRLFQTQAVAPSGLSGQAYDVASDGQRFLVKVPAAVSPLTVVVGWPARFDRPL
jgi:Tol biopolymer transport system component